MDEEDVVRDENQAKLNAVMEAEVKALESNYAYWCKGLKEEGAGSEVDNGRAFASFIFSNLATFSVMLAHILEAPCTMHGTPLPGEGEDEEEDKDKKEYYQ